MRVIGFSVGSVTVCSGSTLNELRSVISYSHRYLSATIAFLPLVHGVTFHFLLEVTTFQLSSWCVSSLFSSLSCVISIFVSFVTVFPWSSFIGCLVLVELVALYIKYVSPLVVIFIDGICIFHHLAMGVYVTAFFSHLSYFHWSTVSHVRLARLLRQNWNEKISIFYAICLQTNVIWNYDNINEKILILWLLRWFIGLPTLIRANTNLADRLCLFLEKEF